MTTEVADPSGILRDIRAAAEALRDHPLPQVRAFARQTAAKTEALLDSVLPHTEEWLS